METLISDELDERDFDNFEYDFEVDEVENEDLDIDEIVKGLQRDIAIGYEARQILSRII